MSPTVGRIVHFYPASEDCITGYNGAEVLPAIIVRVWSDSCVNLKVLTDGPYDVWKTSVIKRAEGSDMKYTWDWPVISK